MRTAIIAIAALAFAQPVLAQNKDPEFCTNIEAVARSVMKARQSNVSMTKVMKIVADHFPNDNGLMRKIVIQAYEKPLYSTAEYQEREAEEYANHWAMLCYKALLDDER
jgi:translation initiation factor 2B subunit (eIF-2B alpha/beta/delta family)